MGGTLITLSNGDTVMYDGSQSPSTFYMSEDGTVSTTDKNGKEFKWDLSENVITDDKGKSTTFGDFLGSLGSSINTFLDIVNKTAQTYENTTGSKIINSQGSSAQSGNLSSNDLNTLSAVVNSSINQLKKNALYIGMGITAIILTAVVLKKKRAK